MLLAQGEAVLLAIDRAAGRGEDYAAQPVRATGLHQVEQTDQVDLRVEGRIGDRTSHVHLRRQMHQDLGPLALDYGADSDGGAQIGLVKVPSRVYLIALAGREIVDDGDFMTTAGRQHVNRMRADKAGPASDQYSRPKFP